MQMLSDKLIYSNRIVTHTEKSKPMLYGLDVRDFSSTKVNVSRLPLKSRDGPREYSVG